MRVFTLIAVSIVSAGAMLGSSNSARSELVITCAEEHQLCFVPYTWITVSYGKSGAVVTRSGIVDVIVCDSSAQGFGSDPLFGQVKSCTFLLSDGSLPWKFCVSEGETCNITGAQFVRFGDALSDKWVYGTIGFPFPCTRSFFGDPLPGIRKECQIAR
jgi:hypothetical protein